METTHNMFTNIYYLFFFRFKQLQSVQNHSNQKVCLQVCFVDECALQAQSCVTVLVKWTINECYTFIISKYLYTCCVSWPALGCLSSVYLHRLLGASVSTLISYHDIKQNSVNDLDHLSFPFLEGRISVIRDLYNYPTQRANFY